MVIDSLDVKRSDRAEEVWALQHPAYRTEAALIGVTDLPPLRDTVESLQACGESFWGCWDEDGELIGAVSYERYGDREADYAICRLMVHPDYHRQGIGSRLIRRLIAELPQTTRWTVTAEVRNTPAIALYEKLGFVPVDRFKPIPGIELLRFVRTPSQRSSPT